MPQDNTYTNQTNTSMGTGAPALPTYTPPQGSDGAQTIDPSSNPAAQVAPAVSDTPQDTPATPSTPISSAIVDPTKPPVMPDAAAPVEKPIYTEVADKIRDSKNVLIALSSDPSVDEMATAIGLSLFLDRLGKRATAIYSGATPNALEFLKPEDTFEPSADTLQDFVIALNKEKADHLRYKLDGNFVKIYITPYRTRIAEQDLEFSYGDYNVDLVLALDVANGIDLDSALREHGRIMHDAVIINITTGNPGKFGEIEWSDKKASSLAEMIAKLIYSIEGDVKINKEEATAFLTGIVAATNRFSNASTTPETMTVASRLMQSGANQQLISKNITPDIENEIYSLNKNEKPKKDNSDPTTLDIKHDGKKSKKKTTSESEDKEEETTSLADADKNIESVNDDKEDNDDSSDDGGEDKSLLDDLKAAEANLSQTGTEVEVEPTESPLRIEDEDENADNDSSSMPTAESLPSDTVDDAIQPEPTIPEPSAPEPDSTVAESDSTETESDSINAEPDSTETPPEPAVSDASVASSELSDAEEPMTIIPQGEKVIQPLEEDGSNPEVSEGPDKYGHMLEEAIASTNQPEINYPAQPISSEPNPAIMGAPAVPAAPEINGVPEINYAPASNDEILPPPPAPPIDIANTPMPVMPAPVASPSAEAPAAQAPTAAPAQSPSEFPIPQFSPEVNNPAPAPAATDPATFQIPGA